MLQHVTDFLQNQSGFTHIAFKTALSQISFQSGVDFLLASGNNTIKPFQSVDPYTDGQGSSGLKIFSLSGDEVFNFLFCHLHLLLSCSLFPQILHSRRILRALPSAYNRKVPVLPRSSARERGREDWPLCRHNGKAWECPLPGSRESGRRCQNAPSYP